MIVTRKYDIFVPEEHLQKIAQEGWPSGGLLYTLTELINHDEPGTVQLVETAGFDDDEGPRLAWYLEDYVVAGVDKVLYTIDDWQGEEVSWGVE